MENSLELTKEQIDVLKKTKEQIWKRDMLTLSNEDKYYFEYFIDSLLVENYAWAAHIWYVFIEKYLRNELLKYNHKNIWDNEEFLHFLDREERLLENWDDEIKDLIEKQSKLISRIRWFTFNDKDLQDELIEDLSSYTNEVILRKKAIKNQLSFNNICKGLKEAGLLKSNDIRELKKMFSKYRNPLQHWLFKRLSETYLEQKKVSVVAGWEWWIRKLEIDISNLIMRERGIIKEILKDISIQLFNKIYELFEKLNTLKWKQ